MRQLLKTGGLLTTSNGSKAKTVRLLGAGTQGEVYHANMEGQAVALKWWKSQGVSSAQRLSVSKLCLKEPPCRNFAWPREMILNAKGIFGGYVMELVDVDSYCSVGSRLMQNVTTSCDAIVCSCFNLTRAFIHLHSQGLVYCDLNHDNLLWNPNTGDVILLDPDNITVRGSEVAIDGTYGPMAPELVRQETRPSTATDLHSLAVTIFTMLMGGHPLEGARASKIHCRDEAALKFLHGTNPRFVFDPDDDSNRPVPGRNDPILFHWPRYPQFAQNLFVTAFTVGLSKPSEGRVRETQWAKTLRRLSDGIFYCGNCHSENFSNADGSVVNATCCNCKKSVGAPLCLKLESGSLVSLSVGKKLFSHHLEKFPEEILLTSPWAIVEAHPSEAGVLGLKNLSDLVWQSQAAGVDRKAVAPGQHLRLKKGCQILFGSCSSVIV